MGCFLSPMQLSFGMKRSRVEIGVPDMTSLTNFAGGSGSARAVAAAIVRYQTSLGTAP